MPPVTLTSVVDLSKIKMKWMEQYVSEGLNRKVIPATPKGIYRGFYLVQNITSTRLVTVSAGTDGRHEAANQSVDGFSTTYFDAVGTSITLDLSNSALDNQETVIVLSIVYEIGTDTVANWLAYPIAVWNALSTSAQGEFIVLGTINVPAASTNITTSLIIPKRRTVAWESVAPGATPWSSVIKNPSFEHGVTAADTVQYSISDWVNRVDLAVNGSFRLGTSTVRTGAKSLEFNKSSTSAGVGKIEQYQEIPVIPGQLIHVSGWVRQLIAPTGGSYTFNLYWGDLNSTASSSTAVTASVLSTTDASFRLVDLIVAVPASVFVLKSISIEATGLTTGSTGVALVVDDFQVYVESGGPKAIQGAANARLKQLMTSAVLVEDISTYALGQIAGLLRFDKSTPSSEGQVVFERKDRDYTGGKLPPAWSFFGRLFNLGSQLIGTLATAREPRISAGASVVSAALTLMWESVAAGSYGYRTYVTFVGETIHTVNASWDGTNWNKDLAGTVALRQQFKASTGQVKIQFRASDTAWVDSGWLDGASFDGTTGLTLAANLNVAVSGTGLYKHGTKTVSAVLFNSILTGTAPDGHVNLTSGNFLTIALPSIPVGARIIIVRVTLNDAAGTTVAASVRDINYGAGSSAPVGGSTGPTSAGTGARQVMPTTTVNITTGSQHTYCAEITYVSGSGTCQILGVEMDYDQP